MKKIFSVVLTMLLIVLSTVPAFAAKEVAFSVSNAEVFAGDEFTVDIFVSDYSCLTSGSIAVHYDSKALDFLGLSVGYIVETGESTVSYKVLDASSGNSVIVIDYSDKSGSLTSAGKFISLTFVARDNAAGKYDIRLTTNKTTFSTTKGAVAPKFKNGKINIINNNSVPVSTTIKETTESEESSATDITEFETTELATSKVDPTVNTTAQISSAVSETQVNSTQKSDRELDDTDKLIMGVAVITIFAVAIFIISTNNTKKTTKKRKKKKSRR